MAALHCSGQAPAHAQYQQQNLGILDLIPDLQQFELQLGLLQQQQQHQEPGMGAAAAAAGVTSAVSQQPLTLVQQQQPHTSSRKRRHSSAANDTDVQAGRSTLAQPLKHGGPARTKMGPAADAVHCVVQEDSAQGYQSTNDQQLHGSPAAAGSGGAGAAPGLAGASHNSSCEQGDVSDAELLQGLVANESAASQSPAVVRHRPAAAAAAAACGSRKAAAAATAGAADGVGLGTDSDDELLQGLVTTTPLVHAAAAAAGGTGGGSSKRPRVQLNNGGPNSDDELLLSLEHDTPGRGAAAGGAGAAAAAAGRATSCLPAAWPAATARQRWKCLQRAAADAGAGSDSDGDLLQALAAEVRSPAVKGPAAVWTAQAAHEQPTPDDAAAAADWDASAYRQGAVAPVSARAAAAGARSTMAGDVVALELAKAAKRYLDLQGTCSPHEAAATAAVASAADVHSNAQKHAALTAAAAGTATAAQDAAAAIEAAAWAQDVSAAAAGAVGDAAVKHKAAARPNAVNGRLQLPKAAAHPGSSGAAARAFCLCAPGKAPTQACAAAAAASTVGREGTTSPAASAAVPADAPSLGCREPQHQQHAGAADTHGTVPVGALHEAGAAAAADPADYTYTPLPPAAKAAAEAALEEAAAAAAAAAIAAVEVEAADAAQVPADESKPEVDVQQQQQQQQAPQRVIADAVAVGRLVQLFCPALAAVAALTPEAAGALLHNPAVQNDHPQQWQPEGGLQDPTQLLTLSGIRAACMGLSPRTVRNKLLAAADAAPPRPCRHEEGSGLLPWFLTAHQLLLRELSADVVQQLQRPAAAAAAAGDKHGNPAERLRAAVLARVQLANVVTAAHHLLRQQGRNLPQAPSAAATSWPKQLPQESSSRPRPAGRAPLRFLPPPPQMQEQQQQREQHKDTAEPLLDLLQEQQSPVALAAAEAALLSAATLADQEAAAAAAAGWPGRTVMQQGPHTGRPLVADGAVARGLVQLFCGPALSEVVALCKDTAPPLLHDMPVVLDDPPEYHAGDKKPLEARQLLTHSGLRVACKNVLPTSVRSKLQEVALAVAAAAPAVPGADTDSSSCQGGLLRWFWAAHKLLLQELAADVWQLAQDETPHGERLQRVIRGRVQLAQVVIMAYSLLLRGEVPELVQQAHAAGAEGRDHKAAAAAAAAAADVHAVPAAAPATAALSPMVTGAINPCGAHATQQPLAAVAAAAVAGAGFGAAGGGGAAAAIAAAPGGPVVYRSIPQRPVPEQDLAVAEAALEAVAAQLDRKAAAVAAAGWAAPIVAMGQTSAYPGNEYVADAALAFGLVQLFCPAVNAAAALRWDNATNSSSQLRNLPVELDDPPRWQQEGTQEPLHPAQLLTRSGLLAACAGLVPDVVKVRLQELAVAAAPSYDGCSWGTGLLPFFMAAHELLLLELNCFVWQRFGDTCSHGERLRQLVKGRRQLTELVVTAYNLLLRGRLTDQQQLAALVKLQQAAPAPAPAPAPAAAAGPNGGLGDADMVPADGESNPCTPVAGEPSTHTAAAQSPAVAAAAARPAGPAVEQSAAEGSLNLHGDEQRNMVADAQKRADDGSSAPAAAGAASSEAQPQQQQQQQRLQQQQSELEPGQQAQTSTYKPPSPEAIAKAEAALSTAAIAAVEATAARPEQRFQCVDEAGKTHSKVLIADAAAALRLVQLFYPHILEASALQPDAAAAAACLPNVAVERDKPPRYLWSWEGWSEELLQEQLCCVSGLRLACFGIQPRDLKKQLYALIDSAAAAADDAVDGAGRAAGGSSSSAGTAGLLPWLVAVRDVLLQELSVGVWQDTGDQRPRSEVVARVVMSRVQLAHVVMSVFDFLSHVQQQQQ